jgi:hypothetical protein
VSVSFVDEDVISDLDTVRYDSSCVSMDAVDADDDDEGLNVF